MAGYHRNGWLDITEICIFLFDWNGEPLAQLNLNDFATAFDIDLINGYLYTLDWRTEAFYKYDIREIIGKL